jgi:hypothetical protein
MATSSRHIHRKRQPLSAEFLCLLLVIAAGVLTAWWAGHQVAMNLSGIQTAASLLGLTETTGTTHQVGYSTAHAQDSDTPVAAPYCQAGQSPAFANGLAALKQQVGNAMGAPIECEHADSPGGDTVQHTTTGLAAYNRQTNTDAFTDGWHHWALTPNGLVNWDGTEAQPPLPTTASADDTNPGDDPTSDQ